MSKTKEHFIYEINEKPDWVYDLEYQEWLKYQKQKQKEDGNKKK